MKLTKSETNNAIITTLANVREHPNADRLKLATVLGTQVIVGLDAKDDDLVVYFDSNLRLSHEYLFWNNLYSNKEMNANKKDKGYFGKNGRVRAQRLRGEISNGYAVPLDTLLIAPVLSYSPLLSSLKKGDEFTHIGEVEICGKYFVDKPRGGKCGGSEKQKKSRVTTNMFWKMWDTKHLMREMNRIAPGVLFVEEKIHGTSGRTANALYHRRRRWYQLWKPRITSFWKVVSGTRRVDGLKGHMKTERMAIHEKLAPHVYKGEELYYEIFGYQLSGKMVQKLSPYGCVHYTPKAWDANIPLPYKVMLYRVTVTNEDGYRIDLGREQVYRRADELGLEKPCLLRKYYWESLTGDTILEAFLDTIIGDAQGNSALDDNTLREGIVVWFKDRAGNWSCLKHKSEEFLLRESKQKDNGISDVEDTL